MTESVAAGRRSERTARDGPIRLYYPEYGSISGVLGYWLFYYVVDLATEPLAERLPAVLPDLTASVVTTWLAVTLWFFLGVTILDVVLRQVRPNPHAFESEGERTRFLRSRRPTSVENTLYLGALAVGTALVALNWTAPAALVPRLVATLGSVEALAAVPAFDVAGLVAFFVGFWWTTFALDRLLVGGLRAFVADAS